MPLKLPKGCSKERAEEIKTWCYKIWEMHWKQFAPVSNSRAQFVQYAVRDYEILDEALMKKIELAVQAYTKHLKMKAAANRGKGLIGIRTLSVWYNQSGYEDEFIDESASSLRDRIKAGVEKLKQCEHEGCTNPVHGYAYIYCTDHIPESGLARLRDAYKDLPLDPNRGNLQNQLKTIFAVKRDKLLTENVVAA